MRYILILTLFFGFLQAKSPDACYSVQLKSFYLKRHSSYNFESHHYPSSCILAKINGLNTVRCGCYDDYREAQDNLDRLSERYYDAIIVTTYKRRFENHNYDDSFAMQDSFEDDFSSRNSDDRRYSSYSKSRRKTTRRVTKSRPRVQDYSSSFKNYTQNRQVECKCPSDDNLLFDEEPRDDQKDFYGQEEEDLDLKNNSKESQTKHKSFYGEENDDYIPKRYYDRKKNRDYAKNSERW